MDNIHLILRNRKIDITFIDPNMRRSNFWDWVCVISFSLLVVLVILAFIFLPREAKAQNVPCPAIVSIAQSQIGYGEQWGNNKGIYIRQYLNGRENLPWCAGFVSYCARKSGLNIQYTLRAKDFIVLGTKVNKPKSGDIVVFTRKGGGHVGIIEVVNKNTFVSIEGNTGNYPSKVKRITHRFNENNITGFIRLQKGRS